MFVAIDNDKSIGGRAFQSQVSVYITASPNMTHFASWRGCGKWKHGKYKFCQIQNGGKCKFKIMESVNSEHGKCKFCQIQNRL